MRPAFRLGRWTRIERVELKREYIIPFVGLELGVHKFEYDITDSFFENFEYSIIHKGNVKVELLFEKKETMLIGDFIINGKVETNCSRCNGSMITEVNGEYQLIFKFDTKPSDNESLVTIFPEEFEIDMTEHILEFISVSVPYRPIHDENECDEETMNILSEYILVSKENDSNDEESEESTENSEDDYIDPRWKALQDLSKGKKK